MATRYHNITGSTGVTVTLLNVGDRVSNIKSILITNTHSSNAATVTLFLQRTESSVVKNYKITNLLSIPAKTSFLIDDAGVLNFSNLPGNFGLFITVGSSDTLDVFINT
tara:strand:- start:225 stop:551 length:327 start_codon:yes stop_codon:yes gene_type:complete